MFILGRNQESSPQRVPPHAEVSPRGLRPVRGEVRRPRDLSAGAGARPRPGLPGAQALRRYQHR